jgi:hypothetical protein
VIEKYGSHPFTERVCGESDQAWQSLWNRLERIEHPPIMKRRHKICQIKIGGKIRWALKHQYGYEVIELSKKEQAYYEKTGWPFKLPDRYPGPDWPERLYR